jgi:hypothetical protein
MLMAAISSGSWRRDKDTGDGQHLALLRVNPVAPET